MVGARSQALKLLETPYQQITPDFVLLVSYHFYSVIWIEINLLPMPALLMSRAAV